jgi:cell shape-determining protein MreC
MTKKSLIPAILIALALALYVLPSSVLEHWRLFLYSNLTRLKSLTEETETGGAIPAAPVNHAEELRDLLLQKDAEISSLRLRLQRVAEVREYLPKLQFVTAEIIHADRNFKADYVIIDCGDSDGVAPGDAVLQGQALVGEVARTGARASTVLLLTSPGSLVAARVGKSRVLCSVIGVGNGKAKAVFYGGEKSAVKGQEVMSSGLLEKIPADLLIGALAEDPREGSEPNTLEAEVTLRAAMDSLEDVLVVKNASAADQEELKPGKAGR